MHDDEHWRINKLAGDAKKDESETYKVRDTTHLAHAPRTRKFSRRPKPGKVKTTKQVVPARTVLRSEQRAARDQAANQRALRRSNRRFRLGTVIVTALAAMTVGLIGGLYLATLIL